MNIIALLKPFRQRLAKESALRSLILSGLAVSVLALTPCILRLFIPEMDKRLVIILSCIALLAAGFTLCFLLLFRPTYKKTAARLDEMIKDDRVGTMLEYAGNTTPAAGAQRADTMRRMAGIDPQDIKLRIKKWPAAALCIGMAAIITLLILPGAQAMEPVKDREAAIGDLVDQMMEAIENSGADAGLKERLAKEAQQLGESLMNSQSGEQDQEVLDQASEQIGKDVEQAQAGADGRQEADAAEELGEQLQQMLEEAKQNLPPPGGEEQGEEEQNDGSGQKKEDGQDDGDEQEKDDNGQGGNDGKSEGGDGTPPDGDNEAGGNQTGTGTGKNQMTDSVYDPDSRRIVEYGQVFAAYSAGFASDVEKGILPDTTTNIMNEYFEKLKNGGK